MIRSSWWTRKTGTTCSWMTTRPIGVEHKSLLNSLRDLWSWPITWCSAYLFTYQWSSVSPLKTIGVVSYCSFKKITCPESEKPTKNMEEPSATVRSWQTTPCESSENSPNRNQLPPPLRFWSRTTQVKLQAFWVLKKKSSAMERPPPTTNAFS